MSRFLVSVVCGAVLAAVFAVAPVRFASAQTAADYVKTRQAMMKEMAGHSKAIAAFVKGSKNAKKRAKLGTAGDMEFRAMAIAAIADRLPNQFAQQTSRVELRGMTRAKPDIWVEWEKFYGFTRKLKTLAMALEKAAASGDKKAIGAARAKLGKEACSACHKAFRGKKPKKTS